MVTQAPSLRNIAVAVGFTLSCVGLIIFVWVQFGGSLPLSPQGYRVEAVFNETGLLVPNADVRIAGVNVGKVVRVIPRGTQSLVKLDIEPQYAPIPANTRAILREKTLLGEAYVDLSTGGAGTGGGSAVPKLEDGQTIPNSQVQNTQQLDQVLNAFTKPVQHDFQQFLIGLGSAFHGQGQNLNDAFGNLSTTATSLNQVADILNAQGPQLQTAIRDSGTVLTALGERGQAIGQLISQGNSVLSTTAQENRQLTATIDAFPAFLTQLRATLGHVNTTVGIAKPSLDALTPVAPLLKPALVDLTGLSRPLIDLLRRSPGVLGLARRDLPQVTTFVDALKPLAKVLLPAARQLAPVINIVAAYRNQLTLGMVNLAAILQAQTTANTTTGTFGIPAGSAHYLRQLLTIGPDTPFGQTTRNPAERTNTYFAPGELARVGGAGERAASCAGAGSGNTACQVQPGHAWGHGIPSSYYPHVTAAAIPKR